MLVTASVELRLLLPPLLPPETCLTPEGAELAVESLSSLSLSLSLSPWLVMDGRRPDILNTILLMIRKNYKCLFTHLLNFMKI